MKQRSNSLQIMTALLTIFVSLSAFGNPYAELGIDNPNGASQADIRAAWLKLVRKHNTDNGSSPDQDRIARVNAAYDLIRDEETRYNFDRGFATNNRRTAPGGDLWTKDFDKNDWAAVQQFQEFSRRQEAAAVQAPTPLAQLLKAHYNHAGHFYSPIFVFAQLRTIPKASTFYTLRKQQEEKFRAYAARIPHIAAGETKAINDFALNMYGEFISDGILSQMKSEIRVIEFAQQDKSWKPEDTAELAADAKKFVGELLQGLRQVCIINLQDCVLKLFAGFEDQPNLYDLLPGANTELLFSMIEEAKAADYGATANNKKLRDFAYKVRLHQSNKFTAGMKACETALKDLWKSLRSSHP